VHVRISAYLSQCVHLQYKTVWLNLVTKPVLLVGSARWATKGNTTD